MNTLNLRIIVIMLSSYCCFSCKHDINGSFSNIENVKFEETTFKIKNYNNIILYDFVLENKSENDYYYEDDMIEDLNCKRNSYNNMFDRLLLFDTINKTLYIDLFYNDLNFQNFIRDFHSVNTLYNNSKIKVKLYYNFADSLKVYYGNVDFVDDLYNEDLNLIKSNKLKEMNKLIEKIKVRVKIYNYRPGPSVYKENATAKILEYEIYNNTKTKEAYLQA